MNTYYILYTIHTNTHMHAFLFPRVFWPFDVCVSSLQPRRNGPGPYGSVYCCWRKRH